MPYLDSEGHKETWRAGNDTLLYVSCRCDVQGGAKWGNFGNGRIPWST